MELVCRNSLAAPPLPSLRSFAAQAADWSDTSSATVTVPTSPSHSTTRTSPKHRQSDHVSGYKYGKNFFSIDLLMSSERSIGGRCQGSARTKPMPCTATPGFGKITGSNLAFGPVRGVGATAGFDYNSKTDAGYNSKKRMLVAGPTLMLDVPGFLDVSLLALRESTPYNTFSHVQTPRYAYKTHAMLTAHGAFRSKWPACRCRSKVSPTTSAPRARTNSVATGAETNIDMQIMYDISAAVTHRRTPSRWAWNTSTGKTSSAIRTPTTQVQPPKRLWCVPSTISNGSLNYLARYTA
jgi:hypothetical protein